MSNKKYIKGNFTSSYKGANQVVESFTRVSKWDILLFDAIITEAEYIPPYNIAALDEENEESLMPLPVENVAIHFKSNDNTPSEGVIFRSINKAIITNVQLHDTIEKGSNTYGKLTGTIYATLEENTTGKQISPVRTTEQKKERPAGIFAGEWNTGCLGNLLKLLLFFILLALIICFISGNCGLGCNNYGTNPGPCDTVYIQVRDTVFKQFEDTSRLTSDSTNYITPEDSLKTSGYADSTIELHDGMVTITLKWAGKSDLDLYVVTPNQDSIFYGNKIGRNGMMLDVDANTSDNIMENPIEHVFLPFNAKRYKGEYKILVGLYSLRPENSDAIIPYSVEIKYQSGTNDNDAVEERYRGFILPNELKWKQLVTKFNLK